METYPDLLPVGGIPQEIHTTLTHITLDVNRAGIGLVTSQPAALDLVVPPFTAHQLFGREFLHNVARHAIENVEQGFIAEAGDAGLKRLDVGDAVAGR